MNSRGVVGAMLAAARVKQDLTTGEVARKLGVSEDKVRALEDGRYEQIPHDIYSEGLIRKYAQVVALDTKAVTERYRQERAGDIRPKARRRDLPAAPIVTSKLSLLILAGLALFLVVTYIVSQVFTLTGDPRLNIVFPSDSQVVYGREVEVAGTTDPGSEIYVDNRLVEVSDDGSFRVEVFLDPGVHEISIESRNQLGRSSWETRTIIVDPDGAQQ